MPQRDRKTHEERVCRSNPAQEEEEYDLYLFWPSLSNRDVSSGDPPSSPLYGPVSLDSESTDLDYTGMSSRSSSPITFAPAYNCRISKEVDLGPPPPDTPGGGEKEPEASEPAKYSPIFKMGLFFSQMTQLFDRAIEGAKIKVRKPKSQAP